MATLAEKIPASSRKIPGVSPEAAESFARAADALGRIVAEKLGSTPDLKELIGHNSVHLMHDHLRNHAAFMATVVGINSPELLLRTMPWVYRAYRERGFSYDYFPAEFRAWQQAIRECPELPDPHKAEIVAIYGWLIQHHEDLVRLSRDEETSGYFAQRRPDENQQVFLAILLNGDRQGCLEFAGQFVHSVADLKRFYLDVVWPSMVIIGELWQANRISVADEHLATAIVGRVMAALYPRFAEFSITRGQAIVSAAPNEFHEVGARMVADFMELDGWDVTFLGANIPIPDLLTLVRKQKPFVVALSVATVFSLGKAGHLIKAIREEQGTGDTRVLVGGNAFSGLPHLWKDLGADGYAPDAESAVEIANHWWDARNG